MTDGKKTVSVISFEPRLRTEVENARKSSEGVALTNCLVQRTKQPGAELEVKATAHTSVVKSPRKFELAEDVEYTAVASSELRSLEEIDGLAVNQRVTVTGKVVSVKPAESVHVKSRGETLQKQDLVLGDSSSRCRAVAWVNHVGVLKVGDSYKLANVTVRSFNGAKYVSLSENSSIQPVTDIGEVNEDVDFGEETFGVRVFDAEVVGVISCDNYNSCASCKAKVVKKSEVMGECTKCGMMVKMSRCKQSAAAKLVLEDNSGKVHKVTAFTDVVEDIVREQVGSTTAEKILSAPVMKWTVTRKDIVSSVTL